MTDYNDGKWHGWNGGECPVHPESMAEWVWHDEGQNTQGQTRGMAGRAAWRGQVLKFRVVEAHREPREAWSVGKHMHDTAAEAVAFRAAVDAANPGRGHLDTPIVHWRKVTE